MFSKVVIPVIVGSILLLSAFACSNKTGAPPSDPGQTFTVREVTPAAQAAAQATSLPSARATPAPVQPSTGQAGTLRIIRRECSSDCVLWEYGPVLRVEVARDRVHGDTGRPSPAKAGMMYLAVEMRVRNVSDSSKGQPHQRIVYDFVAEDPSGKRHDKIYETLTLGRQWYGRDFELTGMGQTVKTVALFEVPTATKSLTLLFESVGDNERVVGNLAVTVPSIVKDILPDK